MIQIEKNIFSRRPLFKAVLDPQMLYLSETDPDVSELFGPDGYIKTWHKLKREHKLHENSYFQWLQVISAIPEG